MRQLRQDPIAGYWVALAKERSHRPFDFVRSPVKPKPGAICPFCPGFESLTPPELLSYPSASQASWRLRVIPNKYPALNCHEVIIDSPEHKDTFGELPESAAVDLFGAVRERILAIRQEPAVQYVQFFKNNGAGSGASLAHPHSQLIALPFVPPQLQLEIQSGLRHHELCRSCIFCDLMDRESAAGDRVILESPDILVIAPYAPRFGFETWILPRRHFSHFESTDLRTLAAAALALHSVVRKIEAVLDGPPYNLLLHTAPVQEPGLPHYHWHVEILPRMSGIGGYEFGTGCYINSILPEETASVLREA